MTPTQDSPPRAILAVICYMVATLVVVAGAVTSLLVLGPTWTGLGAACVSLLAAVLWIGLGQCIQFLATTAHFSRRTAELLEAEEIRAYSALANSRAGKASGVSPY